MSRASQRARGVTKIGVGDNFGDVSPHAKTQNDLRVGGVAAYAKILPRVVFTA